MMLCSGEGEFREKVEVIGGADCIHPAQAEERTPVSQVYRKAGISDATLYKWSAMAV